MQYLDKKKAIEKTGFEYVETIKQNTLVSNSKPKTKTNYLDQGK